MNGDREPPLAAGAPPTRVEGGYGCGAWWWILALIEALAIVWSVVLPWLRGAGVWPTPPA